MAELSREDLATKKDLEDLKKELLDNLASKKELKQELSQYITKEEFARELAKLATKENVEVVARQVLKNTNDIAALKTEMRMGFNRVDDRLDSLETKFDIMMSAIDGIAKEFQNGRTEQAAIDHALSRHDNQIDDHEMRIKKLERRIA